MTVSSAVFVALDNPSQPFLVEEQGVVRSAEFTSKARAIAAQIDDATSAHAPLMLLCRNRGNFIAALCAALDRGREVLLPHDDTPASQDALLARYDRLAILADYVVADFAGQVVDVSTPQTVQFDGMALTHTDDLPLLNFFTSGSTSAPTRHARSWCALARGGSVWANLVGLDETGGGVVATVPPQHMYGMEASVVLPLTQRGIVVWNGQPLYPFDVCRALAAIDGRRVLATTPVHLDALVRSEISLPPLHCIVSATAPLTAELAGCAEELWHAPVHDIYGSTETGMIATRRPTRSDIWRVRPDVDLQFGAEATTARGRHLPGEIRLSDELEPADGGFRLRRRSDDLVNVAGKRASLSELNGILQELPGIRDAAFWVPDDSDPTNFGRPVAFVVADQFDADSIRRSLRGRIADVFIPRQIIAVPALPRDANGKLTRAALEALKQSTSKQCISDD